MAVLNIEIFNWRRLIRCFFLRKLKNSQKKKIYSLLFLFLVATLYLVSITHTKKAIPKRTFFLVNTESKGGKGVYETYKEMKKVGHSVKIVAIPFFLSGKLHADIDLNFLKKFDDTDIIYPCGKQSPYKKCSSIEGLKPEYIFTQHPYNTYKNSPLDPFFTDEYIKKISKKV